MIAKKKTAKKAAKSTAKKVAPKPTTKKQLAPKKTAAKKISAPAAPAPPPAPPTSAPRIPVERPSKPEVEAQIADLERELTRLIDEARAAERSTPKLEADAPKPVPRATPSGRLLPDDDEPTAFDTARELLTTDFYLRKWGRLGMRDRSEQVDDFGYDPVYDEKVAGLLRFLYQRYFRVETKGLENVPADGRCLLVANHSGTVPFDGPMLKMALASSAHPRQVRWLVEDMVFHFPFLGAIVTRLGGVRACPENAERLLVNDALVAVFPEGNKGIGKLFRDRYRLQRFGRGGFVKLCLRTKTPIVPVSIVGGEETNPMLARMEHFASALGVPYIPITPTFPWLGPAGLLPAPTKWKMTFGAPITLSEYSPESQDDDVLVGRLAERVRGTIQMMLDSDIGARKSVFFG